jgi:hypothetical protein
MNPRYQVFISSTFRDLRPERQAVLEAILEMGHFPAGMEVFPAASATPWSLIETIVKESDYYVLIIGGMYGSTDENGVSYTEKEYDLASKSGLPILGFLHGDPSAIPQGRSELSPDSRKRLEAFRQRVEHHHCKYWKTADELKAQVVISLTHEMRVAPRVGWIRADGQADPETLKKLTAAMEENAELQVRLKETREAIGGLTSYGEGLASGRDRVSLHFQYADRSTSQIETTWDSIFLAIAPQMMVESDESVCDILLERFIAGLLAQASRPASKSQVRLVREDVKKVIYQFIALDYIEPVTLRSQNGTFFRQGYKLTKHGARRLATARAAKRDLSSNDRLVQQVSNPSLT